MVPPQSMNQQARGGGAQSASDGRSTAQGSTWDPNDEADPSTDGYDDTTDDDRSAAGTERSGRRAGGHGADKGRGRSGRASGRSSRASAAQGKDGGILSRLVRMSVRSRGQRPAAPSPGPAPPHLAPQPCVADSRRARAGSGRFAGRYSRPPLAFLLSGGAQLTWRAGSAAGSRPGTRKGPSPAPSGRAPSAAGSEPRWGRQQQPSPAPGAGGWGGSGDGGPSPPNSPPYAGGASGGRDDADSLRGFRFRRGARTPSESGQSVAASGYDDVGAGGVRFSPRILAPACARERRGTAALASATSSRLTTFAPRHCFLTGRGLRLPACEWAAPKGRCPAAVGRRRRRRRQARAASLPCRGHRRLQPTRPAGAFTHSFGCSICHRWCSKLRRRLCISPGHAGGPPNPRHHRLCTSRSAHNVPRDPPAAVECSHQQQRRVLH